LADEKTKKKDEAIDVLNNILVVLMQIEENTKVTDTGKPKVGVVVDRTPVNAVAFEGFGNNMLTVADGKVEKVFFADGHYVTDNPLIIKQLRATNFKELPFVTFQGKPETVHVVRLDNENKTEVKAVFDKEGKYTTSNPLIITRLTLDNFKKVE